MRHTACVTRFSLLLPAAATLLVTSCKETTTPATPTRVVFTVQPVTSAALIAIPTFTVAVQDDAGNTVGGATNSVTLRIHQNPSGAGLSGATSVPAVNGVATFSDVRIDRTGVGYTLSATGDDLPFAAISSPFDVIIGPASKLAFIAQPVTSPPGTAIAPAVTVEVRDLADYRVTTASNVVTIAIAGNPGSGTLSGTTSAPAVNGLATFSNLSINTIGVGYTLGASSASLAGAVSRAFEIRSPLVFATISAGYFHTCGLTTAGTAYCWGDNSVGALGNAFVSAATTPMEVMGGLTFAQVVAGRSHSCGLQGNGITYCWGDNSFLQSGVNNRSSVPVAVSGNRTFASVNPGYSHSCGIEGGAGYCWGEGTQGELGSGTTSTTSNPTAVSGGHVFASISPGRLFTCGRTTANAAYCWGENFDGELGDGTQDNRTSPVAVTGQLSFSVVSAGGFHACGLTTGGLAYCWGWNGEGQLGNGTRISSNVPIAVSGGRTFATISAGNRHTCALTPAGAAFCWGDNSLGHLGDGTGVISLVPVAVSGGLTFANISAGRFHSCGVTSSGAGYCWGGAALGNGSVPGERSTVPAAVR